MNLLRYMIKRKFCRFDQEITQEGHSKSFQSRNYALKSSYKVLHALYQAIFTR